MNQNSLIRQIFDLDKKVFVLILIAEMSEVSAANNGNF